MEEKYKERRRY